MSAGFSGVGIVSIAPRLVTGFPGIAQDMGNCPSVKVAHSASPVERNSSRDTARGPNRRMPGNTAGAIEIVCDEYSKPNMVRFLFGRLDTVAAGAVVATTPFAGGATTAVVGSVLLMPDKNVSAVVITDSTGAPKTLVAGVNYELDAFNGSIKLLDITTGDPYVQPFKYSYTKGAVDVISGLARADEEVWVNMAGTNVDTGERGVFDAYRCRFSATENWDLINEGYQDFTIKGAILQDATKTNAGVGGQYYKWSVPTTIA